MRFFVVLKDKTKVFEESPTAEELHLAFLKIVETVQNNEFSEEIQKLKRKLTLSNHIQKLNPFLHEFNDNNCSFSLIRVGGRLLHAPIEYDAKFPLLLTKNSQFIKVYLTHLHRKNCHAGAQAMVALLRQKIWIINAKEACQKVVRNGVQCFRYKPKLLQQIMGNLPADRLRAQRPFLICGVDFCGPVYWSTRNSEDDSLRQRDELCGSPEDLERGWRRVRAREASHLLVRSRRRVQFRLHTSKSPHFGGLWEAAVKAAKTLLHRTVGNALLTAEELLTVLIEVEAILNSRPIAPLSADPNDGEALTPAHLLVGSPLRSLPPENVPEQQMACLRRWQLLCWLKQQFWQKWSKAYLLCLQVRSKWINEQPNLIVGKLVLIHEDHTPPQQWAMGRVVVVVEGQDGKVRVTDIKTRNGILRRPIVKLALIPEEEF
ncbi:uncharacterized protein LOC129950552 [Eupeodes corollae]|uniref:uncharacterized protein LOC129950552 n=1 Tax=Eupeodes corollae TaxID=290404 RepID=UPI0024911933|nr:uncharacterized protein LOC129950552 [Eupeodes corollae]